MRVAFRVDAAPAMGVGHFMRCLCLADALRRRGAAIRVVMREIAPHLRALLDERTFDVTALDGPTSGHDSGDLAHASWLGTTQAADAAETIAALAPDAWDWLVVDHYALDARWETPLRAAAARILAIDDLADRVHDCDVLLDQNIHRDMAQRYAGKTPAACRLLLGPRHALLRDEFRRARQSVSPRTGSVKRVLVSFGGVDAANRTVDAIAALVASGARIPAVDVVIGAQHAHRDLVESECARHGMRCHVQTTRIAELMAAADLAIGAGGITTWERCCLGLPALAVPVAHNQQPVLEEAARHGVVYTPGHETVTAASLALHLRALLDNPYLVDLISHRAMEAVDGRGVDRVARALDDRSMHVREVTADDARALFEWRNHETVRRMSRSAEPITWPAHEAWLRTVLADDDRVLLIGEWNREPVGVVRFDVDRDQAEVSIYRVPGSGEPGLAASLLVAAETWLSDRRPGLARITAYVLGDNERSHDLFQSTGYHLHAALYEKRLSPQ